MAQSYNELLAAEKETETLPAEENSNVSTLGSIFAGIGTGIIEIPKGLFSLGASIYDSVSYTHLTLPTILLV